MRPIIYVLDTDAGPNVISDDVLHSSWQDSIRQREIPDIHSVLDTNPGVFGTISLPLHMSESRTRFSLSAVINRPDQLF